MMAAAEANVQQAMTAQLSACVTPRSSEMRELTEDTETLIDFSAGKLLQTLRSEALAGKRTHHGAIEHGMAEGVRSLLLLGSQIAEESPGKTVACSGGIDNFFERERRGAKRVLFFFSLAGPLACSLEQRSAVFSVLDDQVARAHRHHSAGRFHEVPVFGQHARLGVVDEQHVEAPEHF